MLPKYHIVIGAIISLVLFLIFDLAYYQIFVIFFSSFIFDLDHYLVYVIKEKDLSLRNAYNWFKEKRVKWNSFNDDEKKNHKHQIFIFHGIEFFLIIGVLAGYYELFFLIAIGLFIHMFLDYSEIIYLKDPLYVKSSWIYVYLTNRKKEII